MGSSGLGKLTNRDYFKGMVVTILAAIIGTLLTIIQNQGLVFDSATINTIATSAVVAFLSYLSKNLLTDHNDKIGGQF